MSSSEDVDKKTREVGAKVETDADAEAETAPPTDRDEKNGGTREGGADESVTDEAGAELPPERTRLITTIRTLRRRLIWVLLPVLIVVVLSNMLVTIDETETGVLTQFGEPIQVLSEPGLYIKLPDPLQSVYRFDARLMVMDVRPAEVLTQDKKPLVYEAYACWRIEDPTLYLRTVKEKRGAELRLNSLVLSEINAELGRSELSALLSIEGKSRLDEISQRVTQSCREKASRDFGIEVVQVRFRRLSFPEATRNSVYRRMRSERQRIATKYRAEGEERAAEIRSETDQKVSLLLSEAYRDSEKSKGEGDAAAAIIYAEAYGRDPELYRLVRTLEAYRKFLDKHTVLVLDSNAKPLELLITGQVK